MEDNPEDNWPPPSRDIFTDWQPFFMLGVPGAVSLFVEWGSFELVAGIAVLGHFVVSTRWLRVFNAQ